MIAPSLRDLPDLAGSLATLLLFRRDLFVSRQALFVSHQFQRPFPGAGAQERLLRSYVAAFHFQALLGALIPYQTTYPPLPAAY